MCMERLSWLDRDVREHSAPSFTAESGSKLPLGLLSEEKNKTRQALFQSVVFYTTYLSHSSFRNTHTHTIWTQYTHFIMCCSIRMHNIY